MDASNMPVRRPPQELSTADVKVDQKKAVLTDEDRADSSVVEAPEVVLEKDYAEALKFNEEPVTIRVERSSEKYAPNVVDCWVNGKGVELLIDGRWVETKAVPVGMPVTTKRKYVEVLLRSKIDTLATQHEGAAAYIGGSVPTINNRVERYTSSRAPVSIVMDKNPKSAQWFSQIARANY